MFSVHACQLTAGPRYIVAPSHRHVRQLRARPACVDHGGGQGRWRMPRTVEGFLVDSAARGLNARVRVDVRAMFVALGKLEVYTATLNPRALADAVELAAAVKVKPDSFDTRAWTLIRLALGRAMARVAVDALQGEGRAPGDPQGLVATLDLALQGEEPLLTPDFLAFPARLPLVERLKAPLRQWLQGFGLEPEAAARATHDLGARFTQELDREWGRHPDDYAPLQAALDTPFTRGSERERAWLTYRAYLDAQLDEPIFGETFGLRAVYVPLRAYYEEPLPQAEADDDRDDGLRRPARRTRRVVVDLEAELRRWLDQTDKNDAVRIVCGGPGSGKSSSARHIAAALAREGRLRPVFIPCNYPHLSL